LWVLNSSFTCTLLMSTLGAGPAVSSPHQEWRVTEPPGLAWGPGLPSRDDIAEVLVLSPPGDRFCTDVGPLGYLNLLAGRVGLFSPILAAGEMGLVAAGATWGWGLGKLKPAWPVEAFGRLWLWRVVVVGGAEAEEELVAGGGVAVLFAGELGWFGSCFTARFTKLAALY
jgi:hypothetical protein